METFENFEVFSILYLSYIMDYKATLSGGNNVFGISQYIFNTFRDPLN